MTLNIEKEMDVPEDLDCKKIIQNVVEAAIEYENFPYEAEVNVVLTSNEEIKKINKDYRNLDTATDVLSFPAIDYENPGDFSIIDSCRAEDYFDPETGEFVLGDIVISVEKVEEQAEKYGHSRERELGFLVAHSMLHLFGYDHMEIEERQIMEAKQRDIMSMVHLDR